MHSAIKPKLVSPIIPGADVRRGADELTKDARVQMIFIQRSSETADEQPPLVDEDWRQVCQSMFVGVRGLKWEEMYWKLSELNSEILIKNARGAARCRSYEGRRGQRSWQ